MEKSFAITPWKYALFTTCILISGFNILFFSCGVVTWGSAASVYGGYSAALCGALIFAVSFLGIYVALKESYKFSNYYIMFSIFTIVVLTTYFFIFSSMKTQLLLNFDERIKRLFGEKSTHNDTMQPIHSLFRCCGLDGPQDYLGKEDGGALPASCCHGFDCTVTSHMFEEGCVIKAAQSLQFQAELNYYAAIVILALEFLSLLFAYFMGKARKLLKIKDDEAPINED
ncbi:PREDICTED: 23 kDa integral membrane protein [Drosophila arizonae]|uniref:23 kDa integral membrane protein n=1 Tax=Drosophila arizonae TaxID=7263 RepID=A0ABM1PDN8_DROAR|nr:PREDICTED: 23 kDa integral membrane protein [Drosophila arizonae]XP_017865324.1 PREDICTED: 23 kDa integral membrane protein [Drosophila arizonae]